MPKSIRLLVCILAFAGIALAQDISGPGKVEQVELRLSSTKIMLCLGASLPLEMELINRSDQEIKIDKVDLWNSFSYRRLSKGNLGMGGGQESGCSHCGGNFIFLPPGKIHESKFNFDLISDVFEEPGEYKIKLNYKQVSSNELHFELYDCNPR